MGGREQVIVRGMILVVVALVAILAIEIAFGGLVWQWVAAGICWLGTALSAWAYTLVRKHGTSTP